jgi:hypothetical protein
LINKTKQNKKRTKEMEELKYFLELLGKEKDENKKKFLQNVVNDIIANNHKETMAKIQAQTVTALPNHNHLELEGSATASITTLDHHQKFRITLKGNSKVVIGKEVFQSTAETTNQPQPPKTGASKIIKSAIKAEDGDIDIDM